MDSLNQIANVNLPLVDSGKKDDKTVVFHFLTIDLTNTKLEEKGKDCFTHHDPPHCILGNFTALIFIPDVGHRFNLYISNRVNDDHTPNVQNPEGNVHIQKENMDGKGQRQLKALNYIKTMNLFNSSSYHFRCFHSEGQSY